MRKYQPFWIFIIILTLVLSAAVGMSSRSFSRLVGTPVRAEMAGKDGARVLNGVGEVVNLYATLVADAPAGSGRLLLGYPGGQYGLRPESIAPGDLLLVIQMSGAVIETADGPNYGQVTDLKGVGRYEFITVGRVDQTGVTVCPPCSGLRHGYEAREKVQVIRVPQFSSLRIESGASLTAPPWNGSWGGIVAVHAEGNVVVDGQIEVSGMGYRGGGLSSAGGGLNRSDYVTLQQDYGAEKGEGIAGYQASYDLKGGRYGRGAAANGGGGGTAHNAGGGGGANGDNGAVWNGAGVMDRVTTGAVAWNLDPDLTSNDGQPTSSSGGGRGGYSFADTNRDALTEGPGVAGWGGDRRRNVGGRGGRPLAQDPSGRLFLGGGGGAGAQNNNAGGAGGSSGGLIYLIAGTVSGQGELRANGNAGQDTQRENRDGAGGGGAGGTIVVVADNLGGIRARARGGRGGDQLGALSPNDAESQGPGGGGGGGFIAYRGGTIDTDVGGGANGISRTASLVEFPANGATGGASGRVIADIGPIPFCYTTSDIAVSVSNNRTTIVPGTPTTYTIVVRNTGPNGIWGVEVTDRLPAGFIEGSKVWACEAAAGSTCGQASRTGDLVTTVGIPSQGRVTFSLTALMSPGSVGTVTNSVGISAPAGATDTNASNNSASDIDQLTPVADLEVEITRGADEVVPGLAVDYLINVRNLGPSDASGFNLASIVPETVQVASQVCRAIDGGSCGATQPNGNRIEFIGSRLRAGGSERLTLALAGTISPAARGRLMTQVAIAIPTGAGFTDPNLASNLATDDAPFSPLANLVITKTNHLEAVVAGSDVTYEIEVTNAGPSDALGFDILDELPESMVLSSTDCKAVGGECGTHRLNSQKIEVGGASLRAGSGHSIRMSASGRVRSSATGRLISTATIQLPPSSGTRDPHPESNRSMDDDPLRLETDLSITKTISSSQVTAGDLVTYRIEVSNRGPSVASGARVLDPLPSGLSEATWRCESLTDAVCRTSSGSGSIDALVDLGVMGRAVFNLTAKISPGMGGLIVNTAAVNGPPGSLDPVDPNNSSTAQTSINQSSDLQLTLSASTDNARVGDSMTYRIEVINNGISEAVNAILSTTLPAGLETTSISTSIGSCLGSTTNLVVCQLGTLGSSPAGRTATITITVRIPPNFPTGQITAAASVESQTADPNADNNSGRVTVGVHPLPRPAFSSISVSIVNAASCLGAGNLFNVTIRVENSGTGDQRDNPGSELTIQLPVEVSALIGTCSASTGECLMGNNQLDWNGRLSRGETLTLSYQARVRSGVNTGARFCTRYRLNYDTDGDSINESLLTRDHCLTTNCREQSICTGTNCPALGPGVSLLESTDRISSGNRPASLLIYPFYTSNSVNSTVNNTRINITNSDPTRQIILHLFFIEGLAGQVADNFICLTPNQTVSFLASDIDPDTNGYLLVVAVNENGCPIRMNSLIGDESILAEGGFYATVVAEGVAALTTPACQPSAIETTINLDGTEYSLLGRTLAVDSILSPAGGDRTMLVINGIGGNLAAGGTLLDKMTGQLFNDIEQGFSFTVTEGAQLAQVLSSNYPRSTPRLSAIIPAGRTGWMKIWSQRSDLALTGIRMSRNLDRGSFGDGINLHKLTVGPTSLTIPIIVPDCQ